MLCKLRAAGVIRFLPEGKRTLFEGGTFSLRGGTADVSGWPGPGPPQRRTEGVPALESYSAGGGDLAIRPFCFGSDGEDTLSARFWREEKAETCRPAGSGERIAGLCAVGRGTGARGL